MDKVTQKSYTDEEKNTLREEFLEKIFLEDSDFDRLSKLYPSIKDDPLEKTIYELCEHQTKYVSDRAVLIQKSYSYNPDLKYQLGRRNLQSFIRTILPLIKNQHTFDLILGTGNSGSLMVFITGLVFMHLNKNMPPAITIPIVRYKDKEKTIPFDNSQLFPEVQQTLHDLKVPKVNEVLFVDDDIEKGSSLIASLQLIQKYKIETKDFTPTKCTILAEDQGIMSNIFDQSVEIEFIPYAQGIAEMTNAIMYCLDKEMTQPIEQAFPQVIAEQPRIAINILLDIPIKKQLLPDSKPEYTDQYAIEIRKKISNFEKLKTRAINF